MKYFRFFDGEKMQEEFSESSESSVQVLYRELSKDIYSEHPYRKYELGEDMWSIEQLIDGRWKLRYLVDGENKTAVEFVSSGMILQTVSDDDIDWSSLEDLPQKGTQCAKALYAVYRIAIRRYKDGVAEVDWELNPDGRYYADEDGYGMTDDEEIAVYSYIDRSGKPLVKFRAIKDYDELREMEQEARRKLKMK